MKSYIKTILAGGCVFTAPAFVAPAFAATGPFFSLNNTDFVVSIAFILFIGVLLYLRVPSLVMTMLDKRADDIRAELDTVRALREEAQGILADYERKQKEAQIKAENIITTAQEEAKHAAQKAEQDLKISIARRLKAADEQIDSARAAAIKELRDHAALIATQVAGDIIKKDLSPAQSNVLVQNAIKELADKLHT